MMRTSIVPGMRINSLVVIGRAPATSYRYVPWICRCDCGELVRKPNRVLVSGKAKTCVKCWREVKRHSLRGEIGRSTFTVILRNYQNSAKERDLPYNMTDTEMEKLFKSPCHYCGRPPYRVKKVKKLHGDYTFTGVDRTDPKQGYSPDNCVPCCRECNFLKSTLAQDEFLQWVRKVDAHMQHRPPEYEI